MKLVCCDHKDRKNLELLQLKISYQHDWIIIFKYCLAKRSLTIPRVLFNFLSSRRFRTMQRKRHHLRDRAPIGRRGSPRRRAPRRPRRARGTRRTNAPRCRSSGRRVSRADSSSCESHWTALGRDAPPRPLAVTSSRTDTFEPENPKDPLSVPRLLFAFTR